MGSASSGFGDYGGGYDRTVMEGPEEPLSRDTGAGNFSGKIPENIFEKISYAIVQKNHENIFACGSTNGEDLHGWIYT